MKYKATITASIRLMHALATKSLCSN